jgi:hypothetical protein
VIPSFGNINDCSKFYTVRRDIFARLFADIVLLIALGIVALKLNQKEASEFGNYFLEANRYGPTVFPIVFAAVIGRLMKAVALWRCENDASLGVSYSRRHACVIVLRSFRVFTLG